MLWIDVVVAVSVLLLVFSLILLSVLHGFLPFEISSTSMDSAKLVYKTSKAVMILIRFFIGHFCCYQQWLMPTIQLPL